MSSLKPNKGPGPDNIHSQVLKNCAESLARLLFCIVYTQSVSTGTLPSHWRRANVTPIFKKGSKASPENYKPIISRVIKISETLIWSKMMKYLDEKDITRCQHSFIKKKSCFTNLFITLDQGYGVDVAYLDFCKAFDSVPHQRLL